MVNVDFEDYINFCFDVLSKETKESIKEKHKVSLKKQAQEILEWITHQEEFYVDDITILKFNKRFLK